MYFPICSRVIITQVAQEERHVKIEMDEAREYGVLLIGGYGGLGGPVGVMRPQPAKVVLAEGEVGGCKVKDQRMSVQQRDGVNDIKQSRSKEG